MRNLYLLLILLLTLLTGCSSASLSDALDKEGRIHVEILFQDDLDQVVIFLNDEYSGQPMLSLNTFTKEDSRYSYNAGGEFAQNVDLTNPFEIIKITPVGHSSIIALWGGVFNYPNAATVNYVLKDDEDNEIYRSEVKITDNVVYEKSPDGIYEQANSFHYKILDGENNVLVEW